ncbi:uncharacterized protein LACBIDRAFT_297775 [Laccaria bicolor S238N-H82]|uniref:Predicted protein n=1 Tax=Laccaria bicolor (strain S238N-H82 / ATCC MYA-4686) TaxID=486041 RepID=B0DAV0_LACBS|nr:uncharacterized protein LACBIDRAFT_297775 [Laccaria bicolor S238N-H82]EDR08272.1 predicted protein [Laccaria bicolor S238N-H82]|eukprot:XP_001881342.1 predicted protein [Laccaria bicolor S238N-H82]
MTDATPKIKILKGAAADLSAATYQIHDESHTVGNALRWMLMKNPKVEFCTDLLCLVASQLSPLPFIIMITSPASHAWRASHHHVPLSQLMPSKSFEPISNFLRRSAPHPSENVINVRIQMYGTNLLHCPCRQLPIKCHPDNLSSLQALTTALSDLDSLCETVEDTYLTSLREDKFERWEEKS